MSTTRQLAAIMFTDIVGYTVLMGRDEQKAFAILNKNRELQKPIIEQHNGNWIKELGDGVMASFQTVSDAVNAAIKIQQVCNESDEYQLRIGIHLGEVVLENHDVFGDGVNIASRIQAIADPGSIFISEAVYQNVSNKKDYKTKFVREEILKNVKEPVRMHKIITSISGEYSNSLISKEQLQEKVSKKSIAVLPFVNMSNDHDQEYFSDGIAEEILNSLVHLKDLKVVGRTSSFQFKGKNIDLREIGKKLGVSKVLEGSVRKQGNRLRITAQLINTEDGFHLWSEKYDRDIDDIFDIQDEIASAITEKLKVTLLQYDKELITKTRTDNPEAYQLYLRGRYFWNKRNEEGLTTAIRYFQQAIDNDSDYALAWVGLSDSYSLQSELFGYPRNEMSPKAKAAINKAMEINIRLAEAHISLGLLLMLHEWDWLNAEKEYKLGIELNPNYATGHHWYSEWLMYMDKFEESNREILKAEELDPISIAILKDKALLSYYNRQYNKAIDQANKTLELDSNFALGHRILSLAYQGMEMFDLAIEESLRWQKLTDNHFKTTIALAHIYALSGKKEDAKKMVERFTADEVLNGGDYRGLALVYIALGDNDIAFSFLEKSFERREPSLCSIKIDPKLDCFRSDPRFEKLITRMNFPRNV